MLTIRSQFEEMSNPTWFEKDPALAWGFWGHRCDLYRRTTPNPGFAIMKALGEEKERTGKVRKRSVRFGSFLMIGLQGYFVVTSNVDGQFIKAGFPDAKIMCDLDPASGISDQSLQGGAWQQPVHAVHEPELRGRHLACWRLERSV